MQVVIVVGGGPAGMISAIKSAQNGNKVILLEKNEKLGKKLFITGKGRCNLTNNTDQAGIINNIVSNPKFLFSALNYFSPQDTINLVEEMGVPLKTERGNRVFPVSDKSSDIIKVFDKIIKQNKKNGTPFFISTNKS